MTKTAQWQATYGDRSRPVEGARGSASLLDSWRARPSHPLRFVWMQGRVRYTARDLCAYIALRGGKPRGPGRPRRQDLSVNNRELTAN
jgi:hypothetical protein